MKTISVYFFLFTTLLTLSCSKNNSKDQIAFGLAANDISVNNEGVSKDYGIFDYSLQAENSCIVSTFKIEGSNKEEKLYKLTIHELGHTQSLKHCPEKTCFMRDTIRKNHFNEPTGFCKNVKTIFG
jgi:archaemetzincin